MKAVIVILLIGLVIPSSYFVPPITPVTVVEPKPTAAPIQWYTAYASEYGGETRGINFYYHHFACGGIYFPSVLGVAHKTLPCGTKVAFKYGNRYLTLKVIDRGPYCCGRSFDFTVRAARLLHFPGIGKVKWRIVK